MPASNVCWGIELGAGAVKAVKLQRDGDEVRILEFADIPHKKVLSTPDLDQIDATRVAVGQLVSQHDLTGASIAISIPGHSAFARFAKLPPVEPKKIPDIVKFEAVQQIPFPIEQVEWDYQVFASPDNPDVEVGIFAVTRDKIQERLAMWNEVGVAPDYVTIGPLAVYNAVAFDQQFNDKTPGTVILDVGTTSTDLIVCEPGRLWVRTFPIGGHQFTDALVSAFKLSYQKAEALKRQAEQSKHARHVLQALRPVFGDLAQDVQRSIGYYQSSHKDANLTRLIGVGSTFQLPGLRKYLSQQLQMEVVRLEKFNRISLDGPRAAEFEAVTMNLATAYGLALQGLGFKHGVMVNLVPVVVVRDQVWRKKTKWVAAAAGLSIAAGAISFYRPVVERASNPAASKPAVIAQTVNVINRLKNQWQEASKDMNPDFRATNVAGLIAQRDIHARLLNDVGAMLKSAEDAAAAEPKPLPGRAFTFVSYATAFKAPEAAQPDASGNVPEPTPGQQHPRIAVTLEVRTTRPDADKFVVHTLLTWLKDNAERDGVPYALEIKNPPYELDQELVAAREPTAGGGEPPPDSGSAPPAPGGSRGRRGGGGAGGPGGGGGAPPDRDPGGQGGSGDTNLESAAPIPSEPPLGEPGQTIHTFKIHFDVVVREKKPPAEAST